MKFRVVLVVTLLSTLAGSVALYAEGRPGNCATNMGGIFCVNTGAACLIGGVAGTCDHRRKNPYLTIVNCWCIPKAPSQQSSSVATATAPIVIPSPGQSAEFTFLLKGSVVANLLTDDDDEVTAAATNGISGSVTVNATRRMAPADENIVDFEIVTAASTIVAPSLFAQCLGETGTNSVEYSSLVGTLDIATGEVSIDASGQVLNDIFTMANPLSFMSFHAGVLDLSSSRVTLQSVAKDFLPPSIDGNADDVIDNCTAGPIPATSEWGLVTLVLVVLCAGTILIVRSNRRSTADR